MKEIIAHYNARKKSGVTTCAAIRAVTVQFCEVPRTELQKVLVEKCAVNPSTARTQIQLGRVQANAPVEAKPAKQPAKSEQPAGPAHDIFKNVKAKKAANPVELVVEQPAAVVPPLVTLVEANRAAK